MRRAPILPFLALSALLTVTPPAEAQLSGDRSAGRGAPAPARPLFGGREIFGARPGFGEQPSSGSGPRASRTASSAGSGATSRSPFEGVGTLDLGARYVRGNREAADFVGANTGEQTGFVGARHAEPTEEVRPAVEDLQIERVAPDANLARPSASRRSATMYRPRLRVGFPIERPASEMVNSGLEDRLLLCLAPIEPGRIEVSVEGAKAVLRGEVPSHHQRRLARLLLLLEPGISEVQNDLTVAGPPPNSAVPPGDRP